MPKQLTPPPLWVRFGTGQKLAGLNALSPLYLRTTGNDYSGGDFGSLYALIDLAKETDFSIIQLLPLFDTGDNPSPYQPISFFALNPVYLWVDDPIFGEIGKTIKHEQMQWADKQIPQYIDYKKLRDFKLKFLKIAYKELKDNYEFEKYKNDCMPQTLKYAEFCALKNQYKTDWQQWKTEDAGGRLQGTGKEVDFYLFVQWILEKQLLAVKDYAESKSIYLCLDRPLYPSVQSSDVWANPDLFYLKSDGYPQYISGCNNLQDPFGEQVWGHAVYQFADKADLVKDFFINSISYLSRLCHSIRLDHVAALIWEYYLVDPQTREGKHLSANGFLILQEMIQGFPDIYFIAEDTGFISDTEIDHPLLQLGLPGVHCSQWQDEKNQDPKIYAYNSVSYSSTHDTLSLTGWILTNGNKYNETFEKNYTKLVYQNLNNPSQIAFISLMDLLLDSRRYNLPGSADSDNWQLRMLRKLENMDLRVFKNMIAKSNRKLDHNINFVIITKPNFPQTLKLRTGDSIRLVVATKFKIGKIIIHHNFGENSYLQEWNSLEIHPDSCSHKQVESINLWEFFLKIPQTASELCEIAIKICDGNDKHYWLNEIGKNLKIGVLKRIEN